MYVCMMQGCCTALPPPAHGIPLPVKSVLFLFGLVAFPLFWVVLFGLVLSPPCGVAVVVLVGPASPVAGTVFHRGMVTAC